MKNPNQFLGTIGYAQAKMLRAMFLKTLETLLGLWIPGGAVSKNGATLEGGAVFHLNNHV